MTAGALTVQLTRREAAHLDGLLRQFRRLLRESMREPADREPADPAVARLVPDAYADDAAAARQFRALTGPELLRRREEDARTVAGTLQGMLPASLDGDDALQTQTVTLSAEAVEAWLRTLTALRLVLASRLRIRTEDDHDDRDPRFGVYEWLGYRLDGLVQAADAAEDGGQAET